MVIKKWKSTDLIERIENEILDSIEVKKKLILQKQIILKIYGRVQMVLYRDSTRRQAKKLGLTGWVMNELDGTVKLIAEGEEGDLKQLVDWCYNGSVLAKVDKIDVSWQEATGQFNEFNIKYK